MRSFCHHLPGLLAHCFKPNMNAVNQKTGKPHSLFLAVGALRYYPACKVSIYSPFHLVCFVQGCVFNFFFATGNMSGPVPFSACPKRYWHAPSKSGTSMQDTVPSPSLSYQIPIQVFLAILFLVVILSCFSKYFRQKVFGNPRSPAWVPIWARRKSSGLQFATNMRTWDLERNPEHEFESNVIRNIAVSVSSSTSEDCQKKSNIPNLRALIDSTTPIHLDRVTGKAQYHLQQLDDLKTIVSDTKPYDVVLRQLERSFQMKPRSPNTPM